MDAAKRDARIVQPPHDNQHTIYELIAAGVTHGSKTHLDKQAQ